MKRKGQYRPLGMRLRDLGRSIMRHYSTAQPDSGDPPRVPPVWKAASETPLLWPEEAAEIPGAGTVEELPDDLDTGQPSHPAQPLRRPPAVQRQSQAAPPAPKSESKIDPHLISILEGYRKVQAERAKVREQKKGKLEEIQRNPDEMGIRPRRRRASFDYIDTGVLAKDVDASQQKPVQPAESSAPSEDAGHEEDTAPSSLASQPAADPAEEILPPSGQPPNASLVISLPSSTAVQRDTQPDAVNWADTSEESPGSPENRPSDEEPYIIEDSIDVPSYLDQSGAAPASADTPTVPTAPIENTARPDIVVQRQPQPPAMPGRDLPQPDNAPDLLDDDTLTWMDSPENIQRDTADAPQRGEAGMPDLPAAPVQPAWDALSRSPDAPASEPDDMQIDGGQASSPGFPETFDEAAAFTFGDQRTSSIQRQTAKPDTSVPPGPQDEPARSPQQRAPDQPGAAAAMQSDAGIGQASFEESPLNAQKWSHEQDVPSWEDSPGAEGEPDGTTLFAAADLDVEESQGERIQRTLFVEDAQPDDPNPPALREEADYTSSLSRADVAQRAEDATIVPQHILDDGAADMRMGKLHSPEEMSPVATGETPEAAPETDFPHVQEVQSAAQPAEAIQRTPERGYDDPAADFDLEEDLHPPEEMSPVATGETPEAAPETDFSHVQEVQSAAQPAEAIQRTLERGYDDPAAGFDLEEDLHPPEEMSPVATGETPEAAPETDFPHIQEVQSAAQPAEAIQRTPERGYDDSPQDERPFDTTVSGRADLHPLAEQDDSTMEAVSQTTPQRQQASFDEIISQEYEASVDSAWDSAAWTEEGQFIGPETSETFGSSVNAPNARTDDFSERRNPEQPVLQRRIEDRPDSSAPPVQPVDAHQPEEDFLGADGYDTEEYNSGNAWFDEAPPSFTPTYADEPPAGESLTSPAEILRSGIQRLPQAQDADPVLPVSPDAAMGIPEAQPPTSRTPTVDSAEPVIGTKAQADAAASPVEDRLRLDAERIQRQADWHEEDRDGDPEEQFPVAHEADSEDIQWVEYPQAAQPVSRESIPEAVQRAPVGTSDIEDDGEGWEESADHEAHAGISPSVPRQPLDLFEALAAAGMVAMTDHQTPSISHDAAAQIARSQAEPEAPPRQADLAELLRFLESAPTPPDKPKKAETPRDTLRHSYNVEPAPQSSVQVSSESIMRAESENEPQTDDQQGVDVSKLARDVYALLRQRLRIERERRSRF